MVLTSLILHNPVNPVKEFALLQLAPRAPGSLGSALAMFGLLNLNKPVGVSSAGVLGRIKRLVRPAKIGHAGTLDPLASGVLVACVGPATRLVDNIQRMPKRYRATFLMGRTSESDDTERPVTELGNAPIPSPNDVVRAATRFIGEIEQRPPAFSALKVGGRPAYQLARKGRQVELAARHVTIHRLEVVRYEYPTLVLDIECGSGTYIRALGRDLAESLGTAAVMSALERTAVGSFHVKDACDPNAFTTESLPSRLLSPLLAIPDLPIIQLSDADVELAINGLAVPTTDARIVGARVGQELAGVDSRGELVSILRRRADGALAPALNFRKADFEHSRDV